MKTVILLIATMFAFSAKAQNKTTEVSESFEVNGNCGMCKTNIEKAAKKAGATKADWNETSHVLDVTYNNKKTNKAKIQKSVASAGYDNVGATASDETYEKLHGCCKYERKPFAEGATNDIKACCKAKLEKGETACCMPETAKLHDCCKKSIAAGKEACCKQ